MAAVPYQVSLSMSLSLSSPCRVCSGLLLLVAACNEPAASAEEHAGPPPPAVVVTQAVRDDTLLVERTFLGEVKADSDAALSSAEPARVLKVLVQEGDRVTRGDLLVELDDRLAQAELSEARASKHQAQVEKEHAERQAERYKALEAEQVVSTLEATREADEAERLDALEQGAVAAMKVHGERLFRHRITAPFDGVVARRLVDPGDWLSAGQPALQLLSSGSVQVHVHVPEDVLDELPTLQQVEIVADEQRVAAELRGVVQALDPTTRTALLRLEPKQRPAWLRAGKSVDVAFFVQQTGGWVVPRDALVQGVAGVRVVKVVDGKAQPVEVHELASTAEQVLVSGEFARGDVIVTKGNERLRPGQAVSTEGAFGQPSASASGSAP
jgi:RND family efflux transporter MFP subunit